MFITSSKAKSHHQGWCFCRVVSYLNVKSLPWGTGELDVPAAFCNLDEKGGNVTRDQHLVPSESRARQAV